MSGLPNRMESSRLTHPKPDRTWTEWWAGKPKRAQPASSFECAQHTAVQAHLRQMLDHVEPPEMFKLRDVASMLKLEELDALGYTKEEEAMPGLIELAFEWRELGDLEILQKGKVLGDDVEAYEVEGPVRIRRRVL